MEDLLTINFEARNPARNHHRRYRISIGRDLLADWTVTISHGRAGQVGQVQQFAASDPEVVRAIVRARLLRRLSAPSRIGCEYAVLELDSAEGFDVPAWLPDELMARFKTNAIALSC